MDYMTRHGSQSYIGIVIGLVLRLLLLGEASFRGCWQPLHTQSKHTLGLYEHAMLSRASLSMDYGGC
jgi:hypothetical protein